jgi:D-alanyl-lipoteichoic acid acyltransferase DltB (MBOAT superfamily)
MATIASRRVFFVEPIWLCVLIPILVALVPVGASLVIRRRRAQMFEAVWLAAAGLAIAIVLGGASFAVVLTVFVLITHRAALSIAATADASSTSASSTGSRAGVLAMTLIAQVALVAALARGASIDGPLSQIGGRLVPFGLSLFACHGISYLLSVYRRRVVPESSRLRLAVYLILLPQIVAGPVTIDAAKPQLARRLPSVSDYSFGVRRLVIGIWKVFVMAALATAQTDTVFALRPERLSPLDAWVGLAGFTLQMYYRFSGYGDMAVGLGRMFGIRLPENFRWPLAAESVREFWRRWHTGLSAWFRECAAVAEERQRAWSTSIAAEALVVLLCGVWYGVGWTFVVWGAYHAILVAVERAGLEAVVNRLPALLRHVYLVLAVSLGWLLLRSATLGEAWMFLRALAGTNAPASRVRLAHGYDVWLILAAGAIGCAPLSPMLRRWTVAIDALIVSGLMAILASVLYTWRGVRMISDPMIRFLARTPRSGRASAKRARL